MKNVHYFNMASMLCMSSHTQRIQSKLIKGSKGVNHKDTSRSATPLLLDTCKYIQSKGTIKINRFNIIVYLDLDPIPRKLSTKNCKNCDPIKIIRSTFDISCIFWPNICLSSTKQCSFEFKDFTHCTVKTVPLNFVVKTVVRLYCVYYKI